jgi:Myb-like DNA-binding domain
LDKCGQRSQVEWGERLAIAEIDIVTTSLIQRTASKVSETWLTLTSQVWVAHQNIGAWSKEEEDKLVEIMAEFNYEKPKGEENDTFWRQISHRMGGTRGRHQLRSKWWLCAALSLSTCS